MDKTDTSLLLKSIESKELALMLDIMRLPILKLSEIQISKNAFNIWKKAGYLDSIFGKGNDYHGWNKFSLTQLIVLVIVDMLWERKMNDKIKDYVDAFMNSSELDEQIKSLLEDENQTYLKALEGKNLDLLTYIVTQKKENPNLPSISWIEAISIASVKIDRPYSLLIFEDGRLEFYSTSLLSDYIGLKFDLKMLNETFLNIGFSGLVKKILNYNSANNNPYLKKDSQLMDKYIANGYNIETLIELLQNPSDLEVKQQTIYDRSISKGLIPPKIEDLLREKANQDLLIKVRDGKKMIINRLTINKKQ
jgi:hypothetical protein